MNIKISRIMEWIKRFFLVLWQLPQVCVGVILRFYYIYIKRSYVVGMRRCIKRLDVVHVYHIDSKGSRRIKGLSLWPFIFIHVDIEEYKKTDVLHETLFHELGHALQSKYLGWFYLLVVGLPSVIVTSVSPNIARKLWFEKWANRLGSQIEIKVK